MTSYTVIRDPNNPIITLPQGAEGHSQYLPAPIRLPNGDVWVYVKGDDTRAISAYRSTDGGKSLAYQGVVVDKTPGAWDAAAVLDPVAFYDNLGSNIHLYYKGNATDSGYFGWNIGHAVAPGSNPTAFVKDPSPILRSDEMLTYLQTNLARLNVTAIRDLYFSDFIIGPDGIPTWFGGFCGQHSYANSTTAGYHIFKCRGGYFTDPAPRVEIVSPTPPFTFVQAPCVFRDPSGSGGYLMSYTEGYDGTNNDFCQLTLARSTDVSNWTPTGTVLLAPSPAGWDARKVYGASFLKGGPRHDTLVTIDGSYRLFYSGQPVGGGYAVVGAADVRQFGNLVTF